MRRRRSKAVSPAVALYDWSRRDIDTYVSADGWMLFKGTIAGSRGWRVLKPRRTTVPGLEHDYDRLLKGKSGRVRTFGSEYSAAEAANKVRNHV